MATIHKTTLSPSKLELICAWLPTRAWYRGAAKPALTRAGGFRLDDPAGQVGIEFMVVVDSSGPEAVAYHVPLTYRGAPLDGAEAALVGTAEHGVLGRRWVYRPKAGCRPSARWSGSCWDVARTAGLRALCSTSAISLPFGAIILPRPRAARRRECPSDRNSLHGRRTRRPVCPRAAERLSPSMASSTRQDRR